MGFDVTEKGQDIVKKVSDIIVIPQKKKKT